MKIFMIRNFWQNERPSSTESETESTESEAKVKISSREPMIQIVETVKNLDLNPNELKSEIRRLEYQLERAKTSLQNKEKVITQLTTENEIVANEKVQLEYQLEKSERIQRNQEKLISQFELKMKLEKQMYENNLRLLQYFHPLTITITVVSGHTDKETKEWKDRNLTGCYQMVQIRSGRPVYKVSFIIKNTKVLFFISAQREG